MISEHRATAAILGPLGLPLAELPVKAGSRLTLDENAVPYVQAQLTLATPSEAIMGMLDPRGEPTRIAVTVERRYTGPLPLAAITSRYRGRSLGDVTDDYTTSAGAPSTLAAVTADYLNYYNGADTPAAEAPRRVVLYLLDARENYASGELTLTLGGPEILLIQDVASGESRYTPGAISLSEIVLYVLTATLGPTGLRSDGNLGVVDAEASDWQPGTSAWDYLRGLTEQAGVRLWCDEKGGWRLERNPRPANNPHSWTPANCKTMDRTLSRGGSWGDAVLVLYEWEDANGDRRRRRDYAKDVPNPTKPRVYRRDVPFPGAGAAAHLLKFVRARGQDVALSAVSDYRVVPGDTAAITLPGGDRLIKTVASVDYSIGADEMTVTLRDPLIEGEPT